MIGLVILDDPKPIRDGKLCSRPRLLAENERGVAIGEALQRRNRQNRHADPRQVALRSEMLVRQPVAGYLASVAALRDTEYTARMNEISMPTLCLAGDQDQSTPPDQVRAIAGRVPGAGFEPIAGAEHLPCPEAPIGTAGHFLTFVGTTK